MRLSTPQASPDHLATVLYAPEQRALRESVLVMLRNACTTGHLAPGTRLSEPHLARLLSVSRAPLREAIFQLEGEGILTHTVNRGAQIMEVTPKDVREIYQVRGGLEQVAADILATNDDPEQLERLRLRAATLADPTLDPWTLFSIDLDFHEDVCVEAGNDRLLKAWRQLRSQILICYSLTPLHSLYSQDDFVAGQACDHQRLVEALRQGSGPARMAFSAHIEAAMQRLLNLLSSVSAAH
jgi:DNA-binding GntR family transcriptional regulator